MSSRRNIWFTSDTHFGHKASIGYCNRPFTDLQDMEEKLIKNWNQKVKPNDMVYCLGDMFWNTLKKGKIKEILSRLNGEKHLVIGNHDQLSVIQAMNLGYTSACYEAKIKVGKVYTRLSHYPYRFTLWEHIKKNWNNPKRLFNRKLVRCYDRLPQNTGGWLIHGHIHGNTKFNGKQIHVGVDAWDYRPVSINEIVKYIQKGENGT